MVIRALAKWLLVATLGLAFVAVSAAAAPQQRLTVKAHGDVGLVGGETGALSVHLRATAVEPPDVDMGAPAAGWLRFEGTTQVGGSPATVSIRLGELSWIDSYCRTAPGVFVWTDGFSGHLSVVSGGSTVIEEDVSVHLFVGENGVVSLATLRVGEPIDNYTYWVSNATLSGHHDVGGVSCPTG